MVRCWPVVLGVSLVALLSGCPGRPSLVAGGAPAAPSAPFDLDHVVERPSGPGVLIASPVPTTSDSELADFGDGTARWLQLQVGGHGEFGKTPEWTFRPDFAVALKRPRLRLRLEDRVRVAQLTGITHLALGEISGDAAHATLVYQLWQVPELQPVGPPLRRTGSAAELVQQLPALADELCLRLGVKTTTAPAQLESGDLAWLGRYQWARYAITPEESKALEKVGSHSTLAAVDSLLERAGAKDEANVALAAEYLARREPQNALVLDAIAISFERSYLKSPFGPNVQALQQNLARYPDNLCVHLAEAMSQHTQGRYAAARTAAQKAVGCAPRNPYAWLTLGDLYREAAYEVRRGRYAGQMSQAELRSTDAEYREELRIREKELELCNFRAGDWVALANACLTTGDRLRAEQSLQQALKLDPNYAGAYTTGIEMYSSRWYGNPARQKAYARRALQAQFRTPEDRMDVAKYVWSEVEMGWSWRIVTDRLEQQELIEWVRHQDPKYADLGKPAPRPGAKAEVKPPPFETLYAHNDQAWTVGWDPAGMRLASAGRDKVVKVWDLVRGGDPRELFGQEGSVATLTWSPDGRQLATAGEEALVRIWDPTSGRLERTIVGNCSRILGLSWSSAGNRLAFAGTDGTAHIWDLTKNREQRVLRYPGPVCAVAWSPDGSQLAVAGNGGSVHIWDAATWEKRLTLRGPGRLTEAVAWRPDGRQIAATGADGTIWLWDTPAGTKATVFRGGPGAPRNLSWSADGWWLASGGNAPETAIWDVRGQRLLRTLRGHDEGFNAVSWSRSGRLASAGGNQMVVMWKTPLAGADTRLHAPPRQAPNLTPRVLAESPGKVDAVAFSPDGRLVASAERIGPVRLQEPGAETEPRVLAGNQRPVARLAFSADGRILVGAVDPQGMIAWDVATGKVLWTQDRLPETLETLSVSRDGLIASGNRTDRHVVLRDLHTGREKARVSEDGFLLASAFSGDGRVLAIGSGSLHRWGDLSLWELPSRRRLRTLTGPKDAITAAAFSRDGKQVACGSADATVRVWDVATGKLLHTLRGHEGVVHTVAFLPDGTRVVSTAADGTVRLWDLATGKQLLRLSQPNEKLAVFDLAPDGKSLVTGSIPQAGKGHVHLWKL